MHPFLNIANMAARDAGKIILDGLKRLDFIRSKQKENCSIVTEIDLRAEKVIIEKIQEAYPAHCIIAEESGTIEGDGYTCESDGYTWLIDPLDGTSNFIHDFPHFAISIAIKNQSKNCIEHALVFDPLRQETFTATRGQGAYLNNTQRFSRRLRVSSRIKIEESLLGICIPSRGLNALAPPLKKESLRSMMAQASGIRRTGSAVLDLAYVAAGRLDAALELSLEPWDMATGILLIREAGGIVCDLQGGENYFETGHILGANPKLCRSVLTTLQQNNN